MEIEEEGRERETEEDERWGDRGKQRGLTGGYSFSLSPPPLPPPVFSRKTVFGVTAEEAASELVKTLSSRKQVVVMARSLPKAAIYARSFFPNVFFAVMAAGVRNAAAVEELEQ